jgi:hypothetical protein
VEDPPAEDPSTQDPPSQDTSTEDPSGSFWDDLIQKAKDERVRRQNSPSEIYRRIRRLRRGFGH